MLISIDGAIGAGKTTLVERLASKYRVIYEPVDAWTLLEDFAKDPKKHAYALQFEILVSYYKILKKASKEPLVIVERSPWSSNHVFFDMYVECEKQKQVYDGIYEQYGKPFEPDLIIHLDVDEETSWRRVISRGRPQENGYTKEHVASVVRRYRSALASTHIPVKTLTDCSRFYESAENILDNVVKTVNF
jgi:deoxyadenosine/deoxycytidine kinase